MSAVELIAAYLRERLRARVFIPLAIVLALTGAWLAPSPSIHLVSFLAAAAEAFVFCVTFRVWDDLEDRAADRKRHPTRVMVVAGRTTPFVGLAIGLAAVGVAGITQSGDVMRRLVALALAVTILALWYRARPSENWNRVGGLLVLIKYPLIAFAVAPTLPVDTLSARTFLTLGALYTVICAYEYADDPELRHTFSSRRSLP